MVPPHEIVPESTAERVALWRALHVEVDAKPSVIDDTVGLKLLEPDKEWRRRGDMHPEGTKLFRASIVARARFIEDLVAEEAARGVAQYVLLGAGLDTFAQRRPDLAPRLHVFEVDRPGPQAWKRERLTEVGYGLPSWLRFVSTDFESNGSWPRGLEVAGFDFAKPAVVACTGVSMYLTREAVEATLRDVAALAPGTTLAMTFLLPTKLVAPELKAGLERAAQGARASGTPFVSFFTPDEMRAMARKAGFKDARHVSSPDLAARYFAGRTDGLRPYSGEELLLARR